MTTNCPCGSGKQLSLAGPGSSEQLPFHFTTGIPFSCGKALAGVYDRTLTNWCGPPPEPPPKPDVSLS